MGTLFAGWRDRATFARCDFQLLLQLINNPLQKSVRYMAAFLDQVQVECSGCGADIDEDTEWVLEVGSENLICEDCYEAEESGYLYPSREEPREMDLTEIILEIGKWHIIPVILFLVVEAIVPELLPLMVIPMWGLIAGSYVTYLAHPEKNWLAAVIGLCVLYRSVVTLFQII